MLPNVTFGVEANTILSSLEELSIGLGAGAGARAGTGAAGVSACLFAPDLRLYLDVVATLVGVARCSSKAASGCLFSLDLKLYLTAGVGGVGISLLSEKGENSEPSSSRVCAIGFLTAANDEGVGIK